MKKLLALLALIAAAPSHAVIQTYEFWSNVTDGPYAGIQMHGWLSYDDDTVRPGSFSELVDAGYSIPEGPGQLSGFSMLWNGVQYDTSNASTTHLRRGSQGNQLLDGFSITPHCPPSPHISCGLPRVVPGTSQWWVAWSGSEGWFEYTTEGSEASYRSDLHTTINVPEPETLALMLVGIGFAGLARRRRG